MEKVVNQSEVVTTENVLSVSAQQKISDFNHLAENIKLLIPSCEEEVLIALLNYPDRQLTVRYDFSRSNETFFAGKELQLMLKFHPRNELEIETNVKRWLSFDQSVVVLLLLREKNSWWMNFKPMVRNITCSGKTKPEGGSTGDMGNGKLAKFYDIHASSLIMISRPFPSWFKDTDLPEYARANDRYILPTSRLSCENRQAKIKLSKDNCKYKSIICYVRHIFHLHVSEISNSFGNFVFSLDLDALFELYVLKLFEPTHFSTCTIERSLQNCAGRKFISISFELDRNNIKWQPNMNMQISFLDGRNIESFFAQHGFCDASTQTLHDEKRENFQKLYSKEKSDNQMLKEENFALRRQLLYKDEVIYKLEKKYEYEKKLLQERILTLECKLRNLEKDYKESLYELGRTLVESEFEANKARQKEKIHEIFTITRASASLMAGSQSCANQLQVESSQHPLNARSGQEKNSVATVGPLVNTVVNGDSGQSIRNEAQYHNCVSKIRPGNVSNAPFASTNATVSTERLSFSVQVHERGNADSVNLRNQPTSLVTAEVYNAYRLLLITISNWLLCDNIIKLTEWAIANFSVQTNLSVTETIFQLDEIGVISALDLSPLRIFFETILRYDLMYLMDKFDEGDYNSLRTLIYQNQSGRSSKKRSRRNFTLEGISRFLQPPRTSVRSETPIQSIRNSKVSQRSPTDDENSLRPSNFNTRATGLPTQKCYENSCRGTSVTNTGENHGNEHRLSASDTATGKANRGNKNEQQQSTLPRNIPNPHNQRGNHSHSQSDESRGRASNINVEHKWLCNHYKRRCLVKFECCDKYWPCHRCHNNESTCGRRKLKSRDTVTVKCCHCGKEQQFGRYCISCNTEFSDFFCGICKHLTGKDDYPYHCDKCGICRINGDRSFHCDVCGVCLDVQLRGNHKCRPDSAHDECCICLEDAFTGCQILPCSHKVHKECATRMIRSGITRCPICRESFAHKLQKKITSKSENKR